MINVTLVVNKYNYATNCFLTITTADERTSNYVQKIDLHNKYTLNNVCICTDLIC